MITRLSVDIGGTFTDVVLDHRGRLTTTKVLTTYDDPARGVMTGVDRVLAEGQSPAEDVQLVLHGTTLATNALIARQGAATALLTTAGHRDVLEMAFENRFEQYDVNIDRPEPLVPRHWRVGIEERISAAGDVLVALNEAQVRKAVSELVSQGVESVAIGFLHSYANPSHEVRVAEIIHEVCPQMSVTTSSSVCPEIREYERFSTTAANAYVKPLMRTYLSSLAQRLSERGIGCRVLIMTSGGGLTTMDAAGEYPIRLVESGPAGGAILSGHIASRQGIAEVMSFDMGGTTAKICLVDDGQPQHSRSFEVDRSYRFKKGSGLPVRIPVVEMVEIGAGGGSIAYVDSLKRIQVGPESAGSEPGPACYGRGGARSTITDADVVLGKVSPETFAGGTLKFDGDAANAVVSNDVGSILRMDVASCAHAVVQIVEENMASAARAHAAEWGKTMRGRTLIAFGGAAPLHAVGLAEKLHIEEVLVPRGAGVGSALGFLLAPIRFEVVRSFVSNIEEIDRTRVSVLFKAMRDEALAVVGGVVDAAKLLEVCHCYMRYVGQGYEIAVAVRADAVSPSVLRTSFEAEYSRLYGRTIPGMAIEVLSWTLALGEGVSDGRSLGEETPVKSADDAMAAVELYDGSRWTAAQRLARSALEPGVVHRGPLIVVENQTSTVVPEGYQAEVLADGALRISKY